MKVTIYKKAFTKKEQNKGTITYHNVKAEIIDEELFIYSKVDQLLNNKEKDRIFTYEHIITFEDDI